MELEFNTEQLEIKDIDSKKGIVTAYFAPFGKRDDHNDVHEPQAFDRIIGEFKEKKTRILHLRDHIAKVNGFDHNEVPGVISEIGTDNNGAFFRTKLALKTVVGADTLEQYEAGIITTHSYGADASRSKFKADKKGGRILLDREVKEISSITGWAASDDTKVISLKDMDGLEVQMKRINKVLHHGNLSDEACLKLVKQYGKMKKHLESKYFFVKALELKEPKKWKPSDVLNSLDLKGGDMVSKVLDSLELKRSFNTAKRKELADSGAAMPDGSFPIENEKDLANAINDWGRAGSKDDVKEHIKKRAAALGLTSKLPDNWK